VIYTAGGWWSGHVAKMNTRNMLGDISRGNLVNIHLECDWRPENMIDHMHVGCKGGRWMELAQDW
jgi:hypothetical protein